MSIETLKRLLRVLDEHPPTWGPHALRASTFLELGAFLESSVRPGQRYDLKAVAPNPVWQLVEARLEAALGEAEVAVVPPGGVVAWQMYNSGLLVKTADATLGFDVIPGPHTFGWPARPERNRRLAQLLDALFLTHEHPDHCDPEFVRTCLALGKPVCVPETVARTWPPGPGLHGVPGDGAWCGGGWEVRGQTSVHVWNDTGEELPHVCYEAVLDAGFVLLFTGDADTTREGVGTGRRPIDLLTLPWRNPNRFYEDRHPDQVGTTLDGVRVALGRLAPRALLYEHCAELEHLYNGFPASYDIALKLQESVGLPSALLFWGEKLILKNGGCHYS